MVNWRLNLATKSRQLRTLVIAILGLTIVIALVIVFLSGGELKKKPQVKKTQDLTGIVDESFLDASTDNTLVIQQTELESLKKQMAELVMRMKAMDEARKDELQAQKEEMDKVKSLALKPQEKELSAEHSLPPELKDSNQGLWHNQNVFANNQGGSSISDAPIIHTVSFQSKRRKLYRRQKNYLTAAHYVPSNTSVRAVILGGADSDASVNGQSKNNGTMLFKFLEDGTLPNGQHSRLRGCRVSANSYGDISSERAFATLYRLSCAHPGESIIDKEVTGWVFFNGKVGIKGNPLMRDNKVMTWAGVSGALSGIAQAAQYAQSVQSIGVYGASSVVPSNQIAPFAAYGGAAKAADTLSQYYVKRAEQYHPVIQVGAGNVVTVVFKDGFYLEPDEDRLHATNQTRQDERLIASDDEVNPEMNFTVPPEVLGKIDRANTLSRNQQGALP